MRKLIYFLLFAFLATVQAVNVIGDCGATVVADIKNNAGDFLVLLMFTTVLVLALIYFVANALHRPEYLVLVKDEFFHLGVSLCVLIFFGTVMTLSCGIMQSAFDFAYAQVGATVHPCNKLIVQATASCYMDLMEKDAENIIKVYTTKNIKYQIEDAAKYISYFGLSGGATFAPFAYKRTWATFVDTLSHMFVLPAYVSIKMQNLVVKLFLGNTDNPLAVTTRSTILSFILPGAFILRFFPPTRQMGNMLIALAVGIYLIIPVFLALNGMMYAYIFTPADCAQYSWLLDNVVIGGCDETNTNFLAVARLYPQAFLLPNLTIVIFITFVSSINKALKVFS